MASSLLFGLIAALAWGIHDVCVRFISQRSEILPTLLTVLVAGGIFTLPFALIGGDWPSMNAASYGLAVIAGSLFAIACFSLYKAFAIGPVRLVAPIIGAYPILSVGWASLGGKDVMIGEWLAVLLIISGVAIVARFNNDTSSKADNSAEKRDQLPAIGWSMLAAFGFALTFAMSQAAATAGSELPATIITRLTAIGVIAMAVMVRYGVHMPDLRLTRHQLLVYGMGALDALALGSVTVAGTMRNPEYAAVASSIFGMVTIILAWLVLKEKMTPTQWSGVIIVFSGIAYLGL